MPGNLFTAVTISRRSAAEGGADAPLMPSKTARHTASTLKSASDQLSGGYRAVVRAECTAARPLAHRHQQPNQPSQQDEHEAAASAEDRPFSSARRGGIADRAFWCTKRRFFRQTGVSAPKFSSPAARFWGLRLGARRPRPLGGDPPFDEHPRRGAGGGRHPGARGRCNGRLCTYSCGLQTLVSLGPTHRLGACTWRH